MFIFYFYFGKRRASSLYICKSMIVCTKPVNRLNNYLQFSQDTNVCQASDPSLPCTHRLFQQNHADNHQVRLNLIIREGEPSPNLLSSEFAALNSAHCGGKACCWQQGWRMVTGSWVWKPRQADLVESGEGWKVQGADSQVSLWKKPWKQDCNIHFSARLKSILLLIKSLKYLKKCFQGSGSL